MALINVCHFYIYKPEIKSCCGEHSSRVAPIYMRYYIMSKFRLKLSYQAWKERSKPIEVFQNAIR